MHYGLSSNSFSRIFSQAKTGDRNARIFLRLACFTTSSALSMSARTGQFILSKEQLEELISDSSFHDFIMSLKIDYSGLEKLEISKVDAYTSDNGTLRLPEKSISQNTLFTTPTWLGDLASGNYGPSIRFGDLIAAWRSEGLALSELSGIVSLIDPEAGKGLLSESHIIRGIGLKGSTNPSDPGLSGSKVSLIKPNDWFSLAQFGAIVQGVPSAEAQENLCEALVKNDFTKYKDGKAYLFVADAIMNGNSFIRREFSSSAYREMPDTLFTLAKDSKQYLEEIPADTHLSVIGKIHFQAETGLGDRLDTNIHFHGLSPVLLEVIAKEDSEHLYDSSEEIARVDALLADLSSSEKLYCGHLKTETGQCFFKSIGEVYAIGTLPHVMEVSNTGKPVHNHLTGQPVESSQARLIVTHSNLWSKEQHDRKPSEKVAAITLSN